MKKDSFENIVKYIMFALIIVAGTLLAICHSSCQITSQGITLLGAEESPEITGAKVLSPGSVEIRFNKKVSVESASVSELGKGEKASLDAITEGSVPASAKMSDDGMRALYNFSRAAEIGHRYQLFSEIKDSRGNSLTFALPFDGYNSRIPDCRLTEVQGEAQKSSGRYEYVEIECLEAGNLFGLELYSADDFAKRGFCYEFPVVEVAAGERVMVHLRKYDDVLCVDEIESLSAAKSSQTSAAVRDLYFSNDGACIGANADVILLREKNSLKVHDALIYATRDYGSEWKKKELSAAAAEAVRSGKWSGDGSPACAVVKEGITSSAIKSFQKIGGEWRIESVADWKKK